MKVVRDYKHILWIIIAVSLGAGPVGAAEQPKILAESAILTDAVTGQVLYSKNINVKRPMASTTKIMTAIIALENCDLNEIVTASANATKTPYTSLNLRPGEQVKVKDLLNALMIRSANDAAVALAEHVGGTVSGFAQMMNDKAKLIGAKNTNFVTPNGLHDAAHYSTAYDLALITRYALRMPDFNKIVITQSAMVDRSINKKDLLVQSRSKFLKNYIGADGVKSGYIKQAGYCYVGSATRDGWRLVSVVLKSNDSQAETTVLMDYGFKNYRRLVLADKNRPVQKVSVTGGSAKLEVVPTERVHVAVKPNETGLAKTEVKLDEIHAPIRKGDKVGTITAYVAGKPVVTVDLAAAHDVDESLISATWPWVRSIGLLAMLTIGAACGRTTAKSYGYGRSRLS